MYYMNSIKMQYFDRIDVSEGINVVNRIIESNWQLSLLAFLIL